MPRPALLLFGYVASASSLLEHALWSHETKQPEENLDIESFKRWVAEAGLVGAKEDVERVLSERDNQSRSAMDSNLLFGSKL